VKTVLKVILPFVALGAGIAVFALLIKTRPEAARATTQKPAPLVVVQAVEPTSERALIQGQGTVSAARQIVLQPEISGRITELNDQIIAGGLVKQGERVARIDSRDYRLALNQQQANLESARFEARIEASRRTVAQREWELLGKELPSDEEGRQIALRVPHERNAQANVKAAQSSVSQARNNLSRTTIEAPFNAMVLSESVDKGQLVTPQTQMATLVGTDRFFVQVNLPVDKLGSFDLPGVTPGVTQGAKATIKQRIGAQDVEREARVLRLLGSLDPVGRMAQVILEVKDPLHLQEGSGLPLLLGAFVQVEIQGQSLEGVYSLPNRALRTGDKVWVVDAEGKLVIKPIEVAWSYEDRSLVRGLAAGDKVITGRLSTPVQGMALRTVDQQEAP
jgi:RND family efflux transporter MFP subunit